jgi:hypothetical protein
MDPGEQTTGTRDEHYNLVSVLYHALHGAETTEAYILDAEAAGDERLADFFREAQATQRELAERAKGMLGIVKEAPSVGDVTGAAGGAAMLDDTAPHESEVPPDTEPVDVRGRAAPGVGLPPEDVSSPRSSPEGAVPGDVERGTSPDEPPPATDVPTDARVGLPPERTAGTTTPGTAPLENEVPEGTTPQTPPGDVRKGTSQERSSGGLSDTEVGEVPPDWVPEGETLGEPGRATREQQTAGQTGGEQEKEDKGRIGRAKDRLTSRGEESDRR